VSPLLFDVQKFTKLTINSVVAVVIAWKSGLVVYVAHVSKLHILLLLLLLRLWLRLLLLRAWGSGVGALLCFQPCG
jgi:hypothetical protein